MPDTVKYTPEEIYQFRLSQHVPKDECDHEWNTIDDSFSHEFGTEVIVFQRCYLCGAEQEIED